MFPVSMQKLTKIQVNDIEYISPRSDDYMLSYQWKEMKTSQMQLYYNSVRDKNAK